MLLVNGSLVPRQLLWVTAALVVLEALVVLSVLAVLTVIQVIEQRCPPEQPRPSPNTNRSKTIIELDMTNLACVSYPVQSKSTYLCNEL